MEVIAVDEKHLQVNDYQPDNAGEYKAFWQNLTNEHKGKTIDFCFHNCKVPVEFMALINASVLEVCTETRLVPANIIPEIKETTLITKDNFRVFSELHDKMNPDIYWKSERIESDLKRWHIIVYDCSYTLVSMWSDVAEIFVLEAEDVHKGKVLLSAAATYAFELSKESILFMIDKNKPAQLEAARLTGFTECGEYVAYRGII